MLTTNAPLTLDDIGLLLEGLDASASAHRGPKNGLALKKEARRNQLAAELMAQRNVLLMEMGLVIPAPVETPSKPGKPGKEPKEAKGTAAAAPTV